MKCALVLALWKHLTHIETHFKDLRLHIFLYFISLWKALRGATYWRVETPYIDVDSSNATMWLRKLPNIRDKRTLPDFVETLLTVSIAVCTFRKLKDAIQFSKLAKSCYEALIMLIHRLRNALMIFSLLLIYSNAMKWRVWSVCLDSGAVVIVWTALKLSQEVFSFTI